MFVFLSCVCCFVLLVPCVVVVSVIVGVSIFVGVICCCCFFLHIFYCYFVTVVISVSIVIFSFHRAYCVMPRA